LDGIVRVKLPAVTVWAPKVYTATALFDWVELYRRQVSNEVDRVTVVQEKLALGVQNAVVPEEVGAVALVTVTPPAV